MSDPASIEAGGPSSPHAVPATLDQLAVAAWDGAVARWAAQAHARVPEVERRLYGLQGSLALHRRALGSDLWRAPANVVLAVPQVVLDTGGLALVTLGRRRTGRSAARVTALGQRMRATRLGFETDVGREIGWVLATDLLRLPFRQDGPKGVREARADGLAEALLADPAVARGMARHSGLIDRRLADPAYRARLAQAIAAYGDGRTAAADIAGTLAALSAGAALHQVTPTAFTLGPAVAKALWAHWAIASFPLGSALGAAWYGLFPVAAPLALGAAATGGVVAVLAVVAAFSGVLADPVQRRLGLHRRRLERLIDVVARQLAGEHEAAWRTRATYVARVVDIAEALRLGVRLAG